MIVQRLLEFTLNDKKLNWVDEVTYLGMRISNDLSPAISIKDRIHAAEKKFYNYKKSIWSATNIASRTKIQLYCRLVRPSLLYGIHILNLRKSDEHLLEVFDMKCIRRILRIKWFDLISNDRIMKSHDVKRIGNIVTQCRLLWLGKIYRMPDDRLPVKAFIYQPLGANSRGWPQATWVDCIKKDLDKTIIPIHLPISKIAVNEELWNKILSFID